MKNRLAALQQKLDGAIKAYREHVDAEPAAEAVEAHAAKAKDLKAAMDRAAEAVAGERAAREVEGQALVAGEGAEIVVGDDRKATDAKRGFSSLGDFIHATIGAGKAARDGGKIDPRLGFGAQAPTTYGNESTGADGGYLVPPEFARQVFSQSLDEGSFLPLTNQLPITGNSITFPADETTPWGSDGIRVYWAGEAAAATQTKPVLKERTLKLKKLIGLVPLTDELMADATAAAGFAQAKLGQSLAWKINDAIVNGNGVGAPLGYRNSSVVLSQAAEAGQTADTVNATNVAKMLGRLTPTAQRSSRLRWLINNDVLNQVMVMTLGNQPIWTPPSAGFQAAPAGFLLGRPIVVTQVCQTLGDLGDIQLVDFNEYVTISKGPEYAESMHLFFDYDAGALRLTFRMDGQPWMSSTVSPANGSSTLSPFIQLAAR